MWWLCCSLSFVAFFFFFFFFCVLLIFSGCRAVEGKETQGGALANERAARGVPAGKPRSATCPLSTTHLQPHVCLRACRKPAGRLPCVPTTWVPTHIHASRYLGRLIWIFFCLGLCFLCVGVSFFGFVFFCFLF